MRKVKKRKERGERKVEERRGEERRGEGRGGDFEISRHVEGTSSLSWMGLGE